MVVDKKSILLADQNLDITDDIVKILNRTKVDKFKINYYG